MKISLILLILTQPLLAAENVVRIYKQWHLLAKVKTHDIEASKNLGQYKNQQFIYHDLLKQIKDKKVLAVISEGCENEITARFTRTYNSWNYKKLNNFLLGGSKSQYDDILTLVPLKLEVKLKKQVYTICGDSEELILKHGFAFSDLNGYSGYYTRLKQHKGKNPKKYKLYLDSMAKGMANVPADPVAYAKAKANGALKDVILYIKERNKLFVKVIKENIKLNPALVIGGIHLEDLQKKLDKEKIKYEIVKVEGYPEGSEKILDKLKQILK